MRTIFTGGRLIDGNGAGPRESLAIVIEGDRITEVARRDRVQVEPGDRRIEVEDKTILPGLFNMHEHLTYREVLGNPSFVSHRDAVELTVLAVRNALVALSRGWTTVVEMASAHGIAQTLRDLIARGDMPGPRVLAVGRPICITGGHASEARYLCIEADGPDECRRAVRANFKAGADLVKAMASHDPYQMPGDEQTRAEMSPEELRAIFDEARRWGKLTACHVMGSIAIRNVLEAGVDVLHHGVYLTDELAKQMAEQGTYYCPTLSAYDRQTMNPAFQRGEDWAKAHSVLVKPHEESIRAAIEAGVKIVNGTDSTGSYAEEVELLRAAGMDPMESILACTRHPAEALGLEHRLGTLEAGKLADLVVVDGDPLEDPYAMQRVELVAKEGVFFRPEELRFETEASRTWVDRELFRK
jgi:imidazolonepropionase-like amidohydrolase